jgi:gliding motility-associated-like protein
VTPTACPALSTVATRQLQVQAPPANQRYTSLNAVENRDLQLQARTITGAAYLWTPSVGLSSTTIRNPVYNYNQEQEYRIRIQTIEGCLVNDTLLVRIFKQADILVPEAFSPNGDGHNDLLFARLVGISTLKYFRVYDRWGQVVFQTNLPNVGWDGTYKGLKQPVETYGWIAEGITQDGSTIKRSGSFLLLR